MSFSKKTWKDRITEYPTRRTLTKTDGSTELVTVARSEGSVSQEGDAFDASNMNDLESRIEAGFKDALTGTLTAGDTSITISDESITTDSMIDIYTDVYGVNPSEVTVASGSITLTFDAQETDLSVKVRVM